MNIKNVSPLGFNFIFLMLVVFVFQSCGSTELEIKALGNGKNLNGKLSKQTKKRTLLGLSIPEKSKELISQNIGLEEI